MPKKEKTNVYWETVNFFAMDIKYKRKIYIE